MSTIPPGWYQEGSQLRWWDGSQWTEQFAPLPDATSADASSNSESGVTRWKGRPSQNSGSWPTNVVIGGNAPAIVCPHCHQSGFVSSTSVRKKTGISGGKLTAMLLTCGLSILLTGLSRKDEMTQNHCMNCGMRWTVG